MAFHALRSALVALGIDCSLDSLVTRSGEAFCLAWSDTLDARTLRDTRPAATLAAAAALAGVRLDVEAESEPKESMAALRRHIAAGGLVLAPIFDDARIGVVQGVDLEGMARAVGPDQLEPGGIDISQGWSGAFPGSVAERGVYGVLRADLPAADVPLPVPALAHLLLRDADDGSEGTASVRFGLAAVGAATEEIRRGEVLRDPDGLQRLLVIFEQAEFGFGCAERWSESAEAESLGWPADLARRARTMRASSGELAERLWDSSGRASAPALARAVMGRKSVVFELPPDLDREVPGPVVELARGRAVIVDTRGRRAALSRLADVVECAAMTFSDAAAAVA